MKKCCFAVQAVAVAEEQEEGNVMERNKGEGRQVGEMKGEKG